MKKFLRSFCSLFAFCVGPAFAANFQSLNGSPLLAPEPVANWTGFYVGAFGGANFLKTETLGFGGLRGGYNWQFDHVVLGLQAEANFRPDSSSGVTNWTGIGTQYQASHSSTANSISAFTAHAGYEVTDHFLPFVSGGFAVSDLGLKTTVSGLSGRNTGAYGANSQDFVRVGWTLGGGFEYALTRNWSLEAQYLYYQFAKVTQVTPAYLNGAQVTYFNLWDKGYGSLVSLGANYRF